MIKVYVAGAISSSSFEVALRNVGEGIRAGATLLSLGYSPFVPHLDFQYNLTAHGAYMDVNTYYKHDLEWLAVCDCMFVLEGWENSVGVVREIKFAEENNIPIYYDLSDLMEEQKCSLSI